VASTRGHRDRGHAATRARRQAWLGAALALGLTLAPAAASAAEPDAGAAGRSLPRIAEPRGAAAADTGAEALVREFRARRITNGIKTALAGAGATLLLWGAWLERRGRPAAYRRQRDAALLALGLASGLAWWNFGQFHFPRYVHPADMFHYYMGSKYFRELGYTGLYECAAIADLDVGRAFAERGARIRNLETNRLEPVGPVLDDPSRCLRHFTPARWREFRRDAQAFRSRLPRAVWQKLRTDHGYNGTPVWGILGSVLANTGPATPGRLLALSLLDPVLLLAMWATVGWAFGWRTLCVALLFWGTNQLAQFPWTGGSFLRQDWLAAAVAGICCLRRARPRAGGFLLATSALLRIFPALLLGGLALQAAARMVRRRGWTLSPSHRRTALGGLLAVATLVPLSALVAGGFGAWPAFAANSRLHLDTPLVNHVGLRTALSHDPASRAELLFDRDADDPYAAWKAARRDTFARRRAVFAGAVLAFAALLALAAERRADWVAAVLGIGLLPVAGEVTCYYYGILLGYAFLWPLRRGIGVALCAFAAFTWLAAEIWHWTDSSLVATSLAATALVLYATLALLRSPAPTPPEAAAPGP
jgi:hypothetical protein